MTPEQADELMGVIRAGLHDRELDDVIAELDRMIAEGVEDQVATFIDEEGYVRIREQARHADQVRRRRAGPIEALQIALRLLHERLVVLPAVARAMEKRIGSRCVVWRPDTEFVRNDEQTRVQTFELSQLRGESAIELDTIFRPLAPVLAAPAEADVEA